MGITLRLAIYLIAAVRTVVANPAVLEKRQASSCSPLELIIARGTTEPGPYGIVVGDPLLNATQQLIPNVTGYAVNYPATFACDSLNYGINDTVQHIELAGYTCPQQQYVLVGYSQGADVMHYASTMIPTYLYPRIIALVMFGDPGNRGPNITFPIGSLGPTPPFPAALAEKLKENCAVGDPVCTNNGTDVYAHTSYHNPGTTYITDSAAYIQEQYETDGNAGPSPGTPPGVGDNSAAVASLGLMLGATSECPQPATTSTSVAAAATSVDSQASTITSVPIAAASSALPATVSTSNAKRNTDLSGLIAFAMRSMEGRQKR